jgi:outer membrane protein TolC
MVRKIAVLVSAATMWGGNAMADPPAPGPGVTPGQSASSSGTRDTLDAPPTPRVTLADAVKRALANNPTYETAVYEIRRAQALQREARAGYYPTLIGTGTYTRLDSDRVFGTTLLAARDQLAANLTLTVPLVAPKQWAAGSHATDSLEATKKSTVEVQRQVALATGQAYLSVVAEKLVIETNERARDTAKKHYDFAHQRLVGGVGNRIDEVRAGQEVSTDEALVQSAYAALAKDEEALGVLAGSEGPLDSAEEPTLPEPPSLATGLDDARKRPDVVAEDARLRAARQITDDNWTEYAPYLVGIAQPFYQNPPTLSTPLTGWQAQLVLTVPFYDGGLRYGLGKEREALASEARVALEGSLRQARSEVRAAFEALRRADDALRASSDAARLANEALRLANIAYSAGATTNLEVIDAERRARDADTDAVAAADFARQARLQMLAVTGRFP